MDLGAGQRLGDGAVLFGAGGVFLELGVVDAGDFGFGFEIDASNREGVVDFLQLHVRGGVDACRFDLRARQSCC